MSGRMSPITPAGSRVQYQALTTMRHAALPAHVEEEEMTSIKTHTPPITSTSTSTTTSAIASPSPTTADIRRSLSLLPVPPAPTRHTRTRSEGTIPRMFSFQVNPATTNGVHLDIIDSLNDGQRRPHATSVSDADITAETAINGGRRGGEGGEEESSFLQTHLKSIIYGGLDGIITTFATVTSVAGADLSVLVILVLGIAHLFADGLSMGMGDAISEASELEHAQAQRKRLLVAYDRDRPSCEQRLITAYLHRGISSVHATRLVSLMSEHPDLLVDTLMTETMEMLPEHIPSVEEDEDTRCCRHIQLSEPLRAGLITMISFILFGSIPLLPYIIVIVPFLHINLEAHSQLIIAIITTVTTLFLLGVIKAALVNEADDDEIPTSTSPRSSTSPRPPSVSFSSWLCCRLCCSPRILSSLWSGFVMALNGSIAAAIGFAIGWILKESIDVKNV